MNSATSVGIELCSCRGCNEWNYASCDLKETGLLGRFGWKYLASVNPGQNHAVSHGCTFRLNAFLLRRVRTENDTGPASSEGKSRET